MEEAVAIFTLPLVVEEYNEIALEPESESIVLTLRVSPTRSAVFIETSVVNVLRPVIDSAKLPVR